MGNEMASGEPSYGMAIMSGKRSGKTCSRCAELEADRNALGRANRVAMKRMRGLSLLRDHLEEELGKMRNERDGLRSRCEKLEVERGRLEKSNSALTNTLGLRFATDMELLKAEAERDEARQWARKYKLAYEKQWKATSYHRREGLDWLSWGQEMDKILKGLRAENAALRAQSAIDNVRMVGMADEIDGLRKELAEARNKALDEAMAVCNKEWLWSSRDLLVELIRALKEKS